VFEMPHAQELQSMSGLEDVTILIPTRNRPELCRALVSFLRASGIKAKIILADSSDQSQIAKGLYASTELNVEHHSLPPDLPFYDKLDLALSKVETSFVAQMPDDDIPIPSALHRCRNFLSNNQDYSTAWGYALNFGLHERSFDIHSMQWCSASIDDASPLERVYHLVRRYQPFFWAVFRTDALKRSISCAKQPQRTILPWRKRLHTTMFQEMTTILTLAMQGKIARLPVVHVMRGSEFSLANRAETGPLFAILDDASKFFAEYVKYRDRLVLFAKDNKLDVSLQHGASLTHFLDLVHSIGLARELDAGTVNYTVQRFLGAPYPEIPLHHNQYGWKEPATEDAVNPSRTTGRRYIWRKAVIQAKRGEEGFIERETIVDVERQLDRFEIPTRYAGH
jgi:glycosyltransferase domain-containing protein